MRQHLAPGSLFADKYTIVRRLGSGGSGDTYEATTTSGEQVALKVLALQGMADWKVFELFEREARVLRSLEHPMIPRYIDDFSFEGPDGPTFCIVQQLAPGSTLQSLVEQGWRTSEAEVQDIATRILEVLIYLHGRLPPVIHRDLKPANVLRDATGHLSLVDFGAVRDRVHTTVGGGSTMVGTYGYMAPEQMQGQAVVATDLYGLGTTLIHLITGHAPSALPTKRLRIQFRGHAQVSEPLARWLDQMLAPVPEERFASAKVALDALLGRPLMPPAPAPASGRLGTVLAASLGAGLVGAVGLGAWFTMVPAQPHGANEPRQPRPASQPVPPSPSPETSTPSASPDVWWPQPTSPNLGGPLEALWATEIGQTTYRSTIHVWNDRIVVNSNGVTRANLPDPRDGVYILDLSGSTQQHIVPPGGGETDSNGVAVAEAGLFFGTDQDMVFHFDWDGTLVWKTPVDGDPEAPPALADFNADGVLDVAVSSEDGTFYLLDGRNGAIQRRVVAGRGEYDQTGFPGPPAIYDVNRDGTPDALVPARDQLFRAIDGKTGRVLWTHKGDSGMHGAPILVDLGFGDTAPELVFTEAYSHVYAADPSSGALHWTAGLRHPGGGIEGLFGPVGYYPDARCIVVGTAWWEEREGVYCLDVKNGRERWRSTEARKNITSGFVVGDVDSNNRVDEVVFGTEGGYVVALDKRGKEVLRQGVGGPVECTPTLADLDGDGTTDILVASGDGHLYAFTTSGVAPKPGAPGSHHRFDAQNSGVMPRGHVAGRRDR